MERSTNVMVSDGFENFYYVLEKGRMQLKY